MKKIIVLAFCLSFLVGNVSQSQSPKTKIFRQLMEDKLKSSQALLEGLALAKYDKITSNAEKLLQISSTAEWFALETPKYKMFSNEFRNAADKIIKKAKEKNIDGVAFAYMQLTITCVRCHEYVREVREARLNIPGANPAALAKTRQADFTLPQPSRSGSKSPICASLPDPLFCRRENQGDSFFSGKETITFFFEFMENVLVTAFILKW